jgi:nanoRNase/pAp phosphatase (c-di-AMP/oligoRNAs hydrolase)
VHRRIIVCDGAELARLWGRIGPGEAEELTWVPRGEEESRARPPGFRGLAGGLVPDAIAKIDAAQSDQFGVVTEEASFARQAIAAIAAVAPAAPVLVLSDRIEANDLPEHRCVRLGRLRSLVRDDLDDEFDHLANWLQVVRIRERLGPCERIGILLQPDPDPDGIASGYALRALLGRKSPTAPLISFGEIKRPENRAMVEALGIEVKTIRADGLEAYDGLALVDVQPTVFGDGAPERVRKVDVVIDHHPERSGYEAAIRDVRIEYGATATILSEYLQAAQVDVRARLATALLYGIKSDTQLLGRETSRKDILSFAFLHAHHSPALLRRIERPALPVDGLRALGRALAETRVEDAIHLLLLGRVREDVIPQVAELGLQTEGAEWSVAAGIVGPDLVFSVRNVGYVRGAGEVVRAVVDGLGVGGGHRSMAKGIIPLRVFRKSFGRADRATIRNALHGAFLRAIRPDGVAPAPPSDAGNQGATRSADRSD